MRKSTLALVALATAPSALAALPMTVSWQAFPDPTEKAFAIDAPKGWRTEAGIERLTPLAVAPWAETSAPDGATILFVGTREMLRFTLPKPGVSEGTTVPAANANMVATVALAYRPGAQFAAYFGPKYLATKGCSGATQTGTKPEPQFAKQQSDRLASIARSLQVPGGFTPPVQEGGLATFTCTWNGKPAAAGILAATAQPTYGGWGAFIAGYVTTPDSAGQAEAMVNHMLASRQFNQQWDQAMQQRTREALAQIQQEGAKWSAILAKQADSESAMLKNQADSNQARLTSEHNAFMDQMNAQSARNNQDFANYEAAKSLNSWNFDAHIRNGNLYRDVNTGDIVEIDRN